MDIEIRQLPRVQAAVFADMVGEAEMGGFYRPDDPEHRSWVCTAIGRYFAPGALFYGAFAGCGEPLGYGVLLVDDAPGFRCKGEIISFGTSAPHRRKGVGSRLIEHITAVCRELDLYCIVTSTYAGDARAVGFYRSNGFSPAALLPGVHGPRDEGQLFLLKVIGGPDWTPR